MNPTICPHCQNTTDPDSIRCLHCGREHNPLAPLPPPAQLPKDTCPWIGLVTEPAKAHLATGAEKMKLPEGVGFKIHYRPKDWQEDSGHENGDYQNKCGVCGELFLGHKRRVVCKTCASPKPSHPLPLQQAYPWWANGFDVKKGPGLKMAEKAPWPEPPAFTAPKWAVRPLGGDNDAVPGDPIAWFADRSWADAFAGLMHPSVVEEVSA